VSSADAAREYHDRTKHSHESVRAGGQSLDWANKPLPFKHYPTVAPLPLPADLPESRLPAIEALSGRAPEGAPDLDLPGLARLLFFSAGVTRLLRADAEPLWLRAAPSAGALYPVEAYVVCGDLDGLAAGVYHFGPVEFALRRLRSGDHRGALAGAAADPALAASPAALVLTGIPWRTAWKYRDRGYRHLFWDSGAILANLLALAEAAALPARLLLGFVDREVALLLDLREPEELTLAIAPLGAPGAGAPGPSPPLEPLGLPVRPLSPSPRDYPLIARTHPAGNLADPGEVEGWRTAATALAAGCPPPAVRPPEAQGAEAVEAVILRRDSTRRFRPRSIPGEGLAWPMGVAARPVPCDFAPSGGSLLVHFLSVHEVDGVAPGAYRWEGGGLELVRSGGSRERSADLCLGQDLGGDSAYTAFHSCRLAPALAALGARGYRAAQLEAGIASGRLQLAARALGLGGTGLTFFDDEVSRLFATDAAPMTATAVGVPAHRSAPGRRPRDMPRLRVEDGRR
jgi:SagB-type dehydrogenase family enzyme